MGDQLVTDRSSVNAGGGGESRPPLISRYGEKFEEMCGYYLSIGMSYHDYWDGDNCMTKYYRRKDELDKERTNFNLWLQGVYVYEALIDTSPILNALSGKKKPNPYMKSPIAITTGESKQAEQRSNATKLNNGKEAMRAMMAEFNKRFENKEEGGKVNDGD